MIETILYFAYMILGLGAAFGINLLVIVLYGHLVGRKARSKKSI